MEIIFFLFGIFVIWFIGTVVFIVLDALIGFKPEIHDDELWWVASIWPLSGFIVFCVMVSDFFKNHPLPVGRFMQDKSKSLRDLIRSQRKN